MAVSKTGEVVGYAGSLKPFRWTVDAGLTYLDILEGGNSAIPAAVNGSGVVVGNSLTSTNNSGEAVAWLPDGSVVDMGNLGGFFSAARAINDNGEAAGVAALPNSDDQHAFTWTQSGGIKDLGTVNNIGTTQAIGINNAGQVVGEYNNNDDPNDTTVHTVRWTADGTIQDLGTLGGPSSEPAGIDNAGDVYGNSQQQVDGGYVPFRWTPATGMQALPTLPGSGGEASVESVSATGWSVGTSLASDGNYHAVRWDPQGNIANLGLINGYTSSYGDQINNNGQVAGNIDPPSGYDAAATWGASDLAYPAVTSAASDTVAINTPFDFKVTTSGAPPASTITATGTLPSGVTFTNNGDGTADLTGTITAAGTFPITVTASNGTDTSATQSFSLVASFQSQVVPGDHQPAVR